jgi:adenylate cyclase class IV
MIKEKSDYKLPNVEISSCRNKSFVFIHLNEVEKTETDEEGNEHTYYEYDFNEFSGLTESLPIEDIRMHPEYYLHYSQDNRTVEQKVDDHSISISELEQCIMDMSEIIYQ